MFLVQPNLLPSNPVKNTIGSSTSGNITGGAGGPPMIMFEILM